jgi:hypothetical protein
VGAAVQAGHRHGQQLFRAAGTDEQGRHQHQRDADGAEPAALLPLDGGRIVESLLPPGMAYKYSRLEPYGMWILIALIFTGALMPLLKPLRQLVYHLLSLFL